MRHIPLRHGLPAVATFSIVAADVKTGEVGVAVQSKFLAVGSVVPWVSSDAGAIATQSFANTRYGPQGLALLKDGLHPEEVLKILVAEDEQRDDRQVGIVDMQGRSATYTGASCFAYAGGIAGPGYAAQGNILGSAAVVDGLVSGIQSEGNLTDRMLTALRLAQNAGGDKRGMQSAAIYVAKVNGGYGAFNDRYVDLRVDDHPSPIEELARLLTLQRLYFGHTLKEDRLPLEGDVLAEVKDELRRLGYTPGSGALYDAQTKEQLQAYFLTENFEDRWSKNAIIDRLVLSYMRNQKN